MLIHLKSFLCRIAPLGTGLITAQALAFWRVWQSNQHILRQSQVITEAGWLSIPCGPAMVGLATFKAAFWGGLFFTLSLGAGLCLATWGVLAIMGRSGLRNWFGRIVIAFAWVMILLTINSNGILIWESVFILLVPLAFGWVYLKCRPELEAAGPFYLRFLAPASLILLSTLWFTQYNSDLFINIRDQLLLSNPAGRSVNAFYYRYTLYPAEAFKSFDQKTVRTCSLSGIQDPQLARRLADRLIALNVLPLSDFHPADLSIREDRSQLVLSAHGSTVLTVPVQAFEADPGTWLVRFSIQSDPYGGLRSLISASLILAFPILIFMIGYGFLKMIIGFFIKPIIATWTVSGLCLVLGILLLIPITSINNQNRMNPAEGLSSPKRVDHLVALRNFEQQKMEITAFPQYKELLHSTDMSERYWLARTLAYSHRPESYDHLLELLSDSEPIVRCQALYALGQRVEARAIEPILAHIISSDHWYVQWYGYGALRTLGWHQEPLH
jgi:hypothetical protein